MTAPIRITDLTQRFGSNLVLDRLNLEVPEGSIFALVGPNGAGKTTTIRLLMNLLRPSRGTAEVFGRDARRLSPEDLERIGYVSENQELPDWMSAGQLLAYLKPYYPRWDDARCAELVRQFDLPLDRKLKHLSHGIRMKAKLASSLAYNPSLIILDEPFTGLDVLVRDELIGSLLEAAQNATVLISSHDLAEIESFSSHLAYLDRSRVQFSEEMSALTARFRRITVTPADMPPGMAWPANWLNREPAGSSIAFVESEFDPQKTMAGVHRVFGMAASVEITPLPLREIFVALAKAGRKAA